MYSEGLGQAEAENRTVLRQDLERVSQVYQFTSQQLPPGNVPLTDALIRTSKWLQNAWADFNAGRLFDARVKVNTLYHMLADLGKRIGLAKAGGTKELERTKAGSSFLNQVLVALGFKSESEVYRPDVPGGDAADLIGGMLPWAIPAGGLLLFLLLRR